MRAIGQVFPVERERTAAAAAGCAARQLRRLSRPHQRRRGTTRSLFPTHWSARADADECGRLRAAPAQSVVARQMLSAQLSALGFGDELLVPALASPEWMTLFH